MMKKRETMSVTMIVMIAICTSMLCLIFNYSQDTLFQANRTNAVAAVNL